jgi:tetratricopeptide (TPR) repeat protein
MVKDFYEACARKDVDAIVGLWSEKSPQLESRKPELETLFATQESTFSSLAFSTRKIEGDKASLRASVEVTAVDSETKQSQKSKLIRNFQFIKDAGAWKLWGYTLAVEDFSALLIEARPEQRHAMLSAEKELITSDLGQSLIRWATSSFFQQKYDLALEHYNLALSVADQLGDKTVAGYALLGLGNTYRAKSDYARALEHQRKALSNFEASLNGQGMASALENTALTYHKQQNYALAIEYYEKTLKQFEALGNTGSMANTLDNIATVYYDKGSFDSALNYFNRSLALRETLNFKIGIANVLANIGSIYSYQKRYDEAVKHYDRALAEMKESGDPAVVAQVLTALAQIHYSLRNYSAASDYYAKALKSNEQLKDDRAIAGTLENIADLYYDQNNFASALEYFQKSLKIFKGLNATGAIAGLSSSIGRTYYSMRNYASALASYGDALKQFEALSDKKGVIGVLQNIALVYYAQSDYASAIDKYRRSLTIAEEAGSKPSAAGALFGIGLTYAAQANYEEAIEHYGESLKLEQELGNKERIATVLHEMGIAFYLQSNYGLALEYYLKSLTFYVEPGDKKKIAMTLRNIGVVHNSASNYALALEYYQKALAIEEEAGDKEGSAIVLSDIGRVYYLKGEYESALKFFQRSLALWEALGEKPGSATALASIGNVYFGQNNYPQALENYQKALALQEELGNKEAFALLLTGMGNVQFSQEKYDLALSCAERAASIAAEIDNLEILWYARFKAGNARRRMNQQAQAEKEYREAITIVDSMPARAAEDSSKPRFLEGRASPYLAMVELLISQGKANDALSYAEQAKAQALLHLMENNRARITRGMTPQEKVQEKKLYNELRSVGIQAYKERLAKTPDQSRLAALDARLKKARAEYEAFSSRLYASHAALKTQRGHLTPLRFQEVSALVADSNSAILEYAVTGEDAYLFVLTRQAVDGKVASVNQASDTAQHAPLVVSAYALSIKPAELARRVAQFRAMMVSRDKQFTEAARGLYDLLLLPAKGQLANKTRLLIVPDAALWNLPFQCLQPQESRFLIEDAAISYAPSLAALSEMAKLRKNRVNSTQSAPMLIAFGNPALSKQTVDRVRLIREDVKLEPLPDAEREVKTLSQVYGLPRSKVYTGAQASEDRVKTEAGNYRIVHLAANGIIDDLNPMYSSVLLGRSDESGKEDGLLEPWEILNLDLKADLIVFSASQRPGQILKSGEGVIAMTWAFFVAGCPSALISQWGGAYAGAGELMSEFYNGLKSPPEAQKSEGLKAGSLRQAVLKMIKNKEYSHPFYWAGYAVIGEPSY